MKSSAFAVVSVAASLLLLASAGTARAASRNATWSCPQTFASALGEPRELEVQAIDGGAGYAIVGLDALLAETRQARDSDYGPCLDAFLENAGRAAIDLICTDRARRGACVESLAKYDKIQKAAVAEYQSEIARTGAVPPFEAAGLSVPAIDAATTDRLEAAIRGLCGKSGTSLQSLQHLDRVFMATSLPALARASACPDRLAQNYARFVARTLPSSRDCAANSALCARRRQGATAAFDLLAQAGLGGHLASTPSGSSIAELVELTAISDEGVKLACVKATSTPVDIVGNPTTASTSAKYRLQRLADRVLPRDYRGRDGKVTRAGARVAAYRATVNLVIDDANQPGSGRKLFELAKTCYGSLREILRGPDGEYLEIALYAGPQDASAPPATNISVGIDPKTIRTDSAHWNAIERCSVILHETLHLLGLPDEYPETSIGKKRDASGKIVDVGTGAKYPMYDCRAIGPSESMMYHDSDAFQAATFAKTVTVSLCRCASGDCGITADSKACPSGAPRVKHLATFDWRYTEVVGYKERGDELGAGRRYSASEVVLSVVYGEPAEQTLLFGGQFRVITEPGCIERNRVYTACARESTKTSSANFGTDRCGIAVPGECSGKDDSWVHIKDRGE